MTAPIIPNPAPAVPQYPALGSPTFNQEAYASGTALPGVTQWMGETAQGAFTNATSASESAVSANAASQSAATSREIALAATAFKGLWASLAGPLARPASVKHNGRFWLLLNDLANVAASQPGVSADWTSMDTGTVAQDVNTNTTMLPGVVYAVKTLGITLSLPDTLAPGDKFAAVDASGGGFYINWKTRTVRGKTPESPMRVPAARGVDVTFTGSTLV